MSKRVPTINGRQIRVAIRWGLYGYYLDPLDSEDRALLESYANEIIVITLTNPLKKITRSCANCDERASCKERNLGEDKYDVAAKCERWTNKRLTYGTKIYQKPWKRCPTDNAIMQKNVRTGESFCPLCKARKEREARR